MVDSDRRTHALDSLPNDIILEILSQLDAERDKSPTPWFYTGTNLQPTLFALCLVDKRWNDGASRFLYKDVYIVGSGALSLFSRSLEEKQDFRDYVRSFFFTRACDEDGEEWSSLDNARDIQQVYSLCSNLRCERFMHALGQLQSNSAHMQEGRWKELGADAFTCLELRSFDRLFAELFKSETIFPLLEDLIIRDAQLYGSSCEEFRWPVMPRLRRLSLYGCNFQGKHLSLPPSLRALEIIDGNYAVTNIVDEIISVGKSLEILTLIPIFFETHQNVVSWNKWLHELPSVITLRISTTYFYPDESIQMPPRLQHLVAVRMQWHYFDRLHTVQAWVALQVELRKVRSTSSHLRTVKIVGPDVSMLEPGQGAIEEEAERVGIMFSLVHTKKGIYSEDFFKG